MNFRPKTLIFLIVILLCLLTANNILVIPFTLIKFILAWAAFLFIPGESIYSIFIKEKQDILILEKLPIIFCFGLGHISVWGLAAYWKHFTWQTLENVLLLASLFLLITNTILSKKLKPHKTLSLNTAFWSDKTNRTAVILLIIIIVIISTAGFWFSGNVPIKPEHTHLLSVDTPHETVKLGLRTFDRIIHWGYIKKLADNNKIYNQWSSINYSYNIWHLFVVTISKFAGTNYRWVWTYSIFFCIPFAILAVFAFGRALFKDEKLALICALIYLVNTTLFNNYFSDLGLWNWINSPNPREIGFILMTMIGFFYLNYLFNQETRFFWPIIFISITSLFIHDIDLLFIIITFLLLAIACLMFRRQDKHILKGIGKILATVLIISIVALCIKAPSRIGLSKPTAVPELVPSAFSGNKIILGIEAAQLGILPTPIIFLSMLLLLPLFIRIRENKAALFLVATTALPPLIAYNPAIPFLLSKALAPFNIHVPIDTIAMVTGLRTACIFPAVYVCAYALYHTTIYCIKRINNKILINGLSLAAGIIIALIASNQFNPGFFPPFSNFLNEIHWPYYPPWAILLLIMINLLLLLSECFLRFPSRLFTAHDIYQNSQTSTYKNKFNPLGSVLIFSLTAITLTLPAEFKYFSGPVHFQPLQQLLEGSEGFRFLNNNIPKERIILSDPITSLYLPAYTGHKNTGFAAVANKKEEDLSLLSALNPYTTAQTRLSLLKKYKVNYLYLDWKIINKRLEKELIGRPKNYRLRYENKNTALYEISYPANNH